MKDMVLGAQKQYKEQNNGYLSNGLMAILKFWDDPDALFNMYVQKVRAEEKKKNMRGSHADRAIEQEYNSNVRGSTKSLKTIKKNPHSKSPMPDGTIGRKSTAL